MTQTKTPGNHRRKRKEKTMSRYKDTSFRARYRRAADNIIHQRTHGRELDEAFEWGDGDQMVIALMDAAAHDVNLKRGLEIFWGSPTPHDSWARAYNARPHQLELIS